MNSYLNYYIQIPKNKISNKFQIFIFSFVLIIYFFNLNLQNLYAETKSPAAYTTIVSQIERQAIAGARPVYFDQSVADLLGITPPPGRIGTKEFDDWIIHNFAFEIKTDGTSEATSALQINKFAIEQDAHGGSGRAGFIFVPTKDEEGVWVNLKGIGLTGEGNTKGLKKGPPSSSFSSHSDGSATLEEAVKEAVMSRVVDNDTKRGSSRVLAIIHTGRVIKYADGNQVPLAIIIRAPLRRYDQEQKSVHAAQGKKASTESLAFLGSRRMLKGDFVNDSNMGAQGEIIDFGCITHTCGFFPATSSQGEGFLKEAQNKIVGSGEFKTHLGFNLLNQLGIPEKDIETFLPFEKFKSTAQSVGEEFIQLVYSSNPDKILLDFTKVDPQLLKGKLNLHSVMQDLAFDFFNSETPFTSEEWVKNLEKLITEKSGFDFSAGTVEQQNILKHIKSFGSDTYTLLSEIRLKKLQDPKVRKAYAEAIKQLAIFKNREIEGIVRPNLFSAAGEVSNQFREYQNPEIVSAFIEDAVITNKLSTNSSGFGSISIASSNKETSLYVRAYVDSNNEAKLFSHPELIGAKAKEEFYFRITTDGWATHKDIKAKIMYNKMGLPFFKVDIPHGTMPVTGKVTEMVPFVMEKSGKPRWLKEQFNVKTSPLMINERLGLESDFEKVPDVMRRRYNVAISSLESDFAPAKIINLKGRDLDNIVTTLISRTVNNPQDSFLYTIAMNLDRPIQGLNYQFSEVSEDAFKEFYDQFSKLKGAEALSKLSDILWEEHLKKINLMSDNEFKTVALEILNNKVILSSLNDKTLLTFIQRVEGRIGASPFDQELFDSWLQAIIKNNQTRLSSAWLSYFEKKDGVALRKLLDPIITAELIFPRELNNLIKVKLVPFYEDAIRASTEVNESLYEKLFILDPENLIFKNRKDKLVGKILMAGISELSPQAQKQRLKILLKMKPEAFDAHQPILVTFALSKLTPTKENLEILTMAVARAETLISDQAILKLQEYPAGTIDNLVLDKFLRAKMVSGQHKEWIKHILLLKGDVQKNISELLANAYRSDRVEVFNELINYLVEKHPEVFNGPFSEDIKKTIAMFSSKNKERLPNDLMVMLSSLAFDKQSTPDTLREFLIERYKLAETTSGRNLFFQNLKKGTLNLESISEIKSFFDEVLKGNDLILKSDLIDEIFINNSSEFWSQFKIKAFTKSQLEDFFVELSKISGQEDKAYERLVVFSPNHPHLKKMLPPKEHIELLVKSLNKAKETSEKVAILNRLLHFRPDQLSDSVKTTVGKVLASIAPEEALSLALRAIDCDSKYLSNVAFGKIQRDSSNKIIDPVAIRFIKAKVLTSTNPQWSNLLPSIKGEVLDHLIPLLKEALALKRFEIFDQILFANNVHVSSNVLKFKDLILERLKNDPEKAISFHQFQVLLQLKNIDDLQDELRDYAFKLLTDSRVNDLDKERTIKALVALQKTDNGKLMVDVFRKILSESDFSQSPYFFTWLNTNYASFGSSVFDLSKYVERSVDQDGFSKFFANHFKNFKKINLSKELSFKLYSKLTSQEKSVLVGMIVDRYNLHEVSDVGTNLLDYMAKNETSFLLKRLRELQVVEPKNMIHFDQVSIILSRDKGQFSKLLTSENDSHAVGVGQTLRDILNRFPSELREDILSSLEKYLKEVILNSTDYDLITKALMDLKYFSPKILERNTDFLINISINGLSQMAETNHTMMMYVANQALDYSLLTDEKLSFLIKNTREIHILERLKKLKREGERLGPLTLKTLSELALKKENPIVSKLAFELMTEKATPDQRNFFLSFLKQFKKEEVSLKWQASTSAEVAMKSISDQLQIDYKKEIAHIELNASSIVPSTGSISTRKTFKNFCEGMFGKLP